MKLFNKKIFNCHNLAVISLMILLDLCFVLAFFSAFYFIAQKIIEILVYVAQISAGDALAITRSATDPYIVLPLYTYLFFLVFSLSAIWIIFQGINWWITKDIMNKFNNHEINHSVNHAAHDKSHKKDSFLKFMLKFAGISMIWLFFVFLTIAATISLLVANFANQMIPVNAILIIPIIALIFFSYFYISTLREIKLFFLESIVQGFINSFTWKYFLKYILIVALMGILSYAAYYFMQNLLIISIIIIALIIISLSYFRIIINLE